MMSQVAPFGTWRSALAPAALGSSNVKISMPALGADGSVWWVEGRPSEGGRGVLVRDRGGAREDVVPAPFSVRTRVHEYGGRAWVADGEVVYFCHDGDHCVYRMVIGEAPARVTEPRGWRFAELIVDRAQDRLIAVGELHEGGGHPTNHLVSIDLTTGAVVVLVTGADFYAAPALSPDGRRLAWLSWDHPHMPWDAAAAWVAFVGRDHVVEARHVAGGPDGSAFQPTWPGDALLLALEVGDRWALHTWRDGVLSAFGAVDGEVGAPLWVLGTRLFAAMDDGSVIAAVMRRGLSDVVRFSADGASWVSVDDALLHVGDLVSDGRDVLLSVGWAGAGSRLVRLGGAVVVDKLAGVLHPDDTSHAELIEVPTETGPVYAWFFAPRSREFEGPPGALPPLVVLAHGGPTGCTVPNPSMGVHFWTTRGYAVLDVNYRGSSGFGRAYREALRREWGIVDVADCVACAQHVARTGRVDGDRMVIRGGSAGGYTVLQALANHRVFRAGACHYGISDLGALSEDTHKFESRYDAYLVGRWPEERSRFEERSPIRYPERITAPIIFFQGLEDKAVPPAQTEAMAATLRARGVDAEYHGYAGEQHGFRRAETIRDTLERELAFYERVLRLQV
jgi:dipeptidyl aminopeptidase/acylaminoacyl peptidase